MKFKVAITAFAYLFLGNLVLLSWKLWQMNKNSNDDKKDSLKPLDRKEEDIKIPPLYLITPTWPNAAQIPELTRLGNSLKVRFRIVRICFYLGSLTSGKIRHYKLTPEIAGH